MSFPNKLIYTKMSTWALDLTGFVRNINDRDIQIEEQLTETTVNEFAQRHVLSLVRCLDANEPIVLEVCYE